MPSYDTTDHTQALYAYRDAGRNMQAAARHLDISRRTLIRWRRDGLPVEVTGGEDWDTWLDAQEQAAIQRARASELEERRDFVQQQQERTERLLDRIYEKLMHGQGVEIKPSDYDKIIRTHLMLQTREEERVEWMKAVMKAVLGVVAEVVDAAQFQQIQAKLVALQRREADKLGLTPAT